MHSIDLFLISIALSLDAFGVALCIGLNSSVKKENKIKFAFSFGFFQFAFALIGAYGGVLFSTYIAAIPNIIGGLIICVVGIMMVKEGCENGSVCPLINTKMYFVIGISVSIDAMVIGFTTLNSIHNNYEIFEKTIFIGVTTYIISILAFMISRYLKKIQIMEKYANYIGGIILILFGIKMIF